MNNSNRYLRKANDRGAANFGWLDSKHSFSFGSYYDPKHMGFSVLRVINDDTVAPGAGFDTHGHRDMEIISYVLDGAVRHEDSMGNQYVVPAGDVQIMSAGTGVMHSEYNDSSEEPVHFLQIWIEPKIRGAKPRYEQKRIEQRGPLTPLVTSDGHDGSLSMNQDASLSRLMLGAGERLTLESNGLARYLHVIAGELSAGDQRLTAGDGFGFGSEPLELSADSAVEALVFGLPIH